MLDKTFEAVFLVFQHSAFIPSYWLKYLFRFMINYCFLATPITREINDDMILFYVPQKEKVPLKTFIRRLLSVFFTVKLLISLNT